jgi:hypothetical protein
MLPRTIADSFSIDLYCACLNLPHAEEFTDHSEGNRSMNPETSTARLSSRSRDITRPSRKPGYVLPRLIWMAIGPGLIMVLSVMKLESHSNQPGPIDVAFLAVACGILLIRWGTWFAGDKCDSFGVKTSVRGLFGFTGLVVVLALGFWTLANLVATQQIAS